MEERPSWEEESGLTAGDAIMEFRLGSWDLTWETKADVKGVPPPPHPAVVMEPDQGGSIPRRAAHGKAWNTLKIP